LVERTYGLIQASLRPVDGHAHSSRLRRHCAWHVLFDPASDWRALQKQAAKEDAPVDALYLNGQQWVTPRDLPKDHPIHSALASDRERCLRGFDRQRKPKKDAYTRAGKARSG